MIAVQMMKTHLTHQTHATHVHDLSQRNPPMRRKVLALLDAIDVQNAIMTSARTVMFSYTMSFTVAQAAGSSWFDFTLVDLYPIAATRITLLSIGAGMQTS